jgi:hypothetical protein
LVSDFSTLDVPQAGAVPVRPLAALGALAAVFIALSGVGGLVLSWCEWHVYDVVRDVVAGDAVTADLRAADQLTRAVSLAYPAVQAAAGVAFLAWLWRARRNTESLSPADHRHSRGWTIGGWFCPLVSLWYPQRIVTDIWRTSRPDAAHTADIDDLPGSRLITTWWVLFLLSSLFTRYVVSLEIGQAGTVDELHDGVRDLLGASVVRIVAVVLIVVIIKRINDWQRAPRAVTGH